MLSTAGMTPEQINRIVRYRLCAECGSFLRRSTEKGETVIICEQFRNHQGIARPFESHEISVAGQRAVIGRRNHMEEVKEKIGVEKTRALEKYSGATSLSKVEAQEIIDTIWPGAGKASPAEVYKAVSICVQYGLNPLMRHLYLIPFSGKFVTVMGIGANRLIASRKHAYSYINDTPRLMNEDEQKRVFGKVDATNLIAITILKDIKTGAMARGYGKWPTNKNVQGEDKGNSQANMAFIRSERQALDRLYPADMPANVEVIDERYEVTATVEPATQPSPGDAPAVSVVEVKFPPTTSIPPAATATAKPEPTPPAGEGTKETTVKTGESGKPVDLTALKFKNAGELTKAAKEHFNLLPSQLQKEIPEYDLSNAGQREKAWQQIVAAYGKKGA